MPEILEFSGISGFFDFVLLCLVFFKCRKKCRKNETRVIAKIILKMWGIDS